MVGGSSLAMPPLFGLGSVSPCLLYSAYRTSTYHWHRWYSGRVDVHPWEYQDSGDRKTSVGHEVGRFLFMHTSELR